MMGHEEDVTRMFPGDTAKHKLTINSEHGVHRCLTMSAPGSFCHGFRIVTYPGGLLYTGDMGTFVFERTEDMFRFFRGGTVTSTKYCAEKCCAGEVREYSEDRARRALEHIKEGYGEDWSPKQQEQLEELTEEWGFADNRQHEFYSLLFNTNFYNGDAPNTEVLTYRFRWCLKAIELTLEEYDKPASERRT